MQLATQRYLGPDACRQWGADPVSRETCPLEVKTCGAHKYIYAFVADAHKILAAPSKTKQKLAKAKRIGVLGLQSSHPLQMKYKIQGAYHP